MTTTHYEIQALDNWIWTKVGVSVTLKQAKEKVYFLNKEYKELRIVKVKIKEEVVALLSSINVA